MIQPLDFLETKHPELSRDTKISSIWVQDGLKICVRSWTGKRPELLTSARWPATLQGAPVAKVAFFQYKCPQTPHFAHTHTHTHTHTKWFSRQSWADSLSLSNFSPEHFKHLRFSSFLYNLKGNVLALNLPLLGSIPWIWGLGGEDVPF